MNKIDFTQPGGFPLDQDVLDFMQQNIYLAAQTANFGGAYCILSGCLVTGTNVSKGYVAINGEILPFTGGLASEKVVIIEKKKEINYADGVARASEIVRYATFGDDGVKNMLWANFKRNTTEGVLARLERLERVAAPFIGSEGGGGIVLWNRPANTIPAGWQEVVNMRGRFPVGLDEDQWEFDRVGETGGAKGVKMTLNNLIAHDHVMRHQITIDYSVASVYGPLHGVQNNYFTRTSELTGNPDPTPMNVLNPYRVVLFIEYVGG